MGEAYIDFGIIGVVIYAFILQDYFLNLIKCFGYTENLILNM